MHVILAVLSFSLIQILRLIKTLKRRNLKLLFTVSLVSFYNKF